MLDQEPSDKDWWTVIYLFGLSAIVAVAAYLVGYNRGERFGVRTEVVTVRKVEEYPPPYAEACAVMIEAAWDMLREDLTPTDQERAELLGR